MDSAPLMLKLGDELPCIVVRTKGGKRFDVKCSRAPRGWKVELHSREPERIKEGYQYNGWVARITPNKSEVLLHEGDFGRLPISDAMVQRYLTAVMGLLGEVELTSEALGDALSMVARIGTQNQADWLTVWQVLGGPTPGDLRSLTAGINALKEVRKSNPEALAELQSQFLETFGSRLRRSAKALVKMSM